MSVYQISNAECTSFIIYFQVVATSKQEVLYNFLIGNLDKAFIMSAPPDMINNQRTMIDGSMWHILWELEKRLSSIITLRLPTRSEVRSRNAESLKDCCVRTYALLNKAFDNGTLTMNNFHWLEDFLSKWFIIELKNLPVMKQL